MHREARNMSVELVGDYCCRERHFNTALAATLRCPNDSSIPHPPKIDVRASPFSIWGVAVFERAQNAAP